MKPIKTIYIAASWKHQHAVEMLTDLLRKLGYDVISWIENNYGEGFDSDLDFEKWLGTEGADKAFEYDTQGAANCDLLIHVGPSGKDAAMETGIAFSKGTPILGLYGKGEDFGLMRKAILWFDRYPKLLGYIIDEYPAKKTEVPVEVEVEE